MRSRHYVLALAASGFATMFASSSARADFILNSASDYAVLYEGGGNNTLQVTNVTTNTAGTGSNAGNGQGNGIGNIGVGGTGKATVSGPSTIGGRVDFSAADTGQFSSNNGSNVINGSSPGTANFGVGAVASALTTVNALNTQMGALAGTNLNINLSGSATQIINANSGTLTTIGGVGYEVFKITGFNTTNGNTLAVVGDAAHDNVVFNFTGDANFNNQVTFTGINADSVLWNFVGGSGLSGGPTLQINNNGNNNPGNVTRGIFLDPNGTVSVTNANVLGRVFGGDSQDFQFVSGSNITAPLAATPLPPTALAGVVLLGGLALARRLHSARSA